MSTGQAQSQSFFRDVTAHAARPWQDPRENRLTAAFAAALRHDPAAATAIVSHWLSMNVTEPPRRIVTQRATMGGVIDLEMQFGGSAFPALVVWVEVKNRSGLSGANQLHKYSAALAGEYPQSETALVLLAPAAFVADVGGDAVKVSWEHVHRVVSERAASLVGEVPRWLLSHLAQYLEEEGEREADGEPVPPRIGPPSSPPWF